MVAESFTPRACMTLSAVPNSGFPSSLRARYRASREMPMVRGRVPSRHRGSGDCSEGIWLGSTRTFTSKLSNMLGTQCRSPARGRASGCCFCERNGRLSVAASYSAAISSASPSWRIISSSRSAASNSALTSCLTRSAASSSSGESWTLR
jgi:hypothetical protein